jgi:hypothetical protein
LFRVEGSFEKLMIKAALFKHSKLYFNFKTSINCFASRPVHMEFRYTKIIITRKNFGSPHSTADRG